MAVSSGPGRARETRVREAGGQGRNEVELAPPVMKLGKFRNARQQLRAGSFVVGPLERLSLAADQHADGDRPGRTPGGQTWAANIDSQALRREKKRWRASWG